MGGTESRLGRVLKDALKFADMAAGEELGFKHDAGYWIHAIDICTEFAKAIGVECGSDEYFEAIENLARTATPPSPAPTRTAGGRE